MNEANCNIKTQFELLQWPITLPMNEAGFPGSSCRKLKGGGQNKDHQSNPCCFLCSIALTWLVKEQANLIAEQRVLEHVQNSHPKTMSLQISMIIFMCLSN